MHNISRRSFVILSACGIGGVTVTAQAHRKQRLYIGPGYAPGQSNIQHAWPKANAETLVSPDNHWLCSIGGDEKSGAWTLWETGHWSDKPPIFRLTGLKGLTGLVLEEDGHLKMVNGLNAILWERGPFGKSDSYSLQCENQGDVALYNANGAKVWSAVRDGVR